MDDLLKSKFVSDLKAGKLPTVTIRIEPITIAQIGLMIVISGLILALVKSRMK